MHAGDQRCDPLGTETKGYSPFTTYQNDKTRFGTEVLEPRSASFASGMFMHLARLIKPYNAARSQELKKHADMAFAAAGDAVRPTHKLYLTGLGFNRVHNPHDRESAFTKRQGWGPRPGILVFGPGGRGRGVSVPAVTDLPRERRYIDNLGSIQWSEFTVYQSLCFPSAAYPVLAQGGKYDERIDPFGLQQK
jgi:hypothetical protein